MNNCVRNDCRLCPHIVISTAVTVVTVDGTDTLVIDIPSSGCYCNGNKVCLIVAQTIPTTATITMPVAISIGGDTTTVYPVLDKCCRPITACAIRTRTKYALRIETTATSAIFKSLNKLNCYPETTLSAIPVPATATPAPAVANVVEQPVVFRTVKPKTTNKEVTE